MEEKNYLWWPEGAEEPDRLEVFKWAKKLAWIIAKGPYQTEEMITELAHVGFLQADSVWPQYQHLPMKQRTRVMGTVIVNAQKAFILDNRPTHPTKVKDEVNPDPCTTSPRHPPADVADEDCESQVESRTDLPVVLWAIHRILTPSERRVMLIVIQFPKLTDIEIAERLGDMTAGSVRAHKCNARKKLKKFLGWS